MTSKGEILQQLLDATGQARLKPHQGSQRKSLAAMLKPSTSPSAQKHSSASSSNSFVVKFNSDVQKLHESEYRSKNPHLFTWNQTFQHQAKLKYIPSWKQKMSQTHVITQDETTEILGTNETSMNTSPTNIHVDSIKEIDHNFEPTQMLKPRKRISRERIKHASLTEECFEDLKELALNQKKQMHLSMSQREKKSYSVVKLQMNLLNNPSSPLVKQVANLEFMSNQFDRRNFNVNKIINKITPHPDMLDKKGIQEETIKKLKYVVKDVKLRRVPKPRTASNSISRPFTFNPQKNDEINISETVLNIDRRSSAQKSPPKTALDLNGSRKKSKVFKFGRASPEFDTVSSQKLEDSPLARNKEEVSFTFIGKSDLKKVLRKVKKLNQTEKFDPKHYSQSVKGGLKELDSTIEQNSKNEQVLRNTMNSKFFVKVQSRAKHPKPSASPQHKIRDDMKENNVVIRSKSPEVDNENMFHYSKYFKNKYLETGLYFEVSKELKQRIKEFGTELKESAQKISTIDLKKHTY